MDSTETLLRESRISLVQRIRDLEARNNDLIAQLDVERQANHSTNPPSSATGSSAGKACGCPSCKHQDDDLCDLIDCYDVRLSEYLDCVDKLRRHRAWAEKAVAVGTSKGLFKAVELTPCPASTCWPEVAPLRAVVDPEWQLLKDSHRKAAAQLSEAEEWKASVKALMNELRRAHVNKPSASSSSNSGLERAKYRRSPFQQNALSSSTSRQGPRSKRKSHEWQLLEEGESQPAEAQAGFDTAASSPARESASRKRRLTDDENSDPIAPQRILREVKEPAPAQQDEPTPTQFSPMSMRRTRGHVQALHTPTSRATHKKKAISKNDALMHQKAATAKRCSPAADTSDDPVTPPGFWEMGFPPTSESTKAWRESPERRSKV